jgi:hypothetical protein
MHSFKTLIAHSKLVVVMSFALAMSACVQPKNHDSNIDSAASFYVDEVKPSMDTAETIPGYTLPASRLYTFTACLKDRRTDDALPGAPFVISGGERDQDIHTDKNGCAIWSEKVAFDYLADEKYLPLDRTITAKGTQVGSRALKIAIDPWNLNGKSPSMYDLDHHTPPKAQIATDEQARTSLKAEMAGGTARKFYVENLPFDNSAVVTTDGTNVRKIRIYLDPRVMLTDIDGSPVPISFGVSSGSLKVTASLMESVTTGGTDQVTAISKVEDVPVVVANGKTSADLQFNLRQGRAGSRYSLAIKVTPFNGPKGLKAFEGLFMLADVSSITLSGSSIAQLKSSNRDNTFDYSAAVAGSLALSADVATAQSLGQQDRITNNGNGAALKTFEMSIPAPKWLGKFEDAANRRTLMYSVQICLKDRSNGGLTPDGVEFSIQRHDKSWVKQSTFSIDPLHGCLVWQDQLSYLYYEPEHFVVIPFTVKHKSGYTETREYAIDPWQAFRTSADPGVTPEFIARVNQDAASNPASLIIDNVEFNTQGHPYYQVDDYMGLKYIKHASLKIATRVARPSNYYDNVNQPEPLRPGRYLLKAAYVSPVSSPTDTSTRLLVSPMLGQTRVVEAKGGFLQAIVDFPVTDIRLFSTRAYLVFEIYLLDGAKVPKNDPDLRSVKDPMDYVDHESHFPIQTFATVLNFKNEKDSSGTAFNTTELAFRMQTNDSINSIASKHQVAAGLQAAVEPLANKTVDVLFAQAAAEQKDYVNRMEPQRSMGAVAVRSNSEVVFVQNESGNSDKDVTLQQNNRILPPPVHAIDALLKTLNTPLEQMGSSARDITGGAPIQITRDSLLAAIGGKTGMDAKLAAQLCGYFFFTQPRTRVTGFDWTKVEFGTNGQWVNNCIGVIKEHGAEGVFSIDHRLRVLETAPVAFNHGRDDLQIKLGTQIGFYQVQTASKTWGAGFGTGGIVSQTAKFLMSAIGGTAMRIFSAVVGGVGIQYERTSTNSAMSQGGFGFELGHGLGVEQTDIDIPVTKSDECIVIRPKASAYQGLQSSTHMKILKLQLGDAQAETLMNRGLMLCAGKVNHETRVAHERYYTLASFNQGGASSDPFDYRNLPWLLQMRGQRDFAAFLVIASASKTSTADANQPIEIGDMPNTTLQVAYDTYFAGKMSTMPGFITLEPKIIVRTHPKK